MLYFTAVELYCMNLVQICHLAGECQSQYCRVVFCLFICFLMFGLGSIAFAFELVPYCEIAKTKTTHS